MLNNSTYAPHVDRVLIKKTPREHLPSFLGIGFPKTGTTWLHAMLAEHPDIQLPEYPISPEKKEFNFWNEYKPHLSTERYIDTFRSLANKQVKGELSVLYTETECLALIREFLSDIKIIIGFRNPIDRIFSSYSHYKRNSGSDRDFKSWFINIEQRYLETYNYNRVMNDLTAYKPQQVFQYIYGNLVANPENEIRKIYYFLGVDETFIPGAAKKGINVSYRFKSRRFHLALSEIILGIYGKGRGRKMIHTPSCRPPLINALLTWNEDPVIRKKERIEYFDYIAEIIYPFCDKFLKHHNLHLEDFW